MHALMLQLDMHYDCDLHFRGVQNHPYETVFTCFLNSYLAVNIGLWWSLFLSSNIPSIFCSLDFFCSLAQYFSHIYVLLLCYKPI